MRWVSFGTKSFERGDLCLGRTTRDLLFKTVGHENPYTYPLISPVDASTDRSVQGSSVVHEQAVGLKSAVQTASGGSYVVLVAASIAPVEQKTFTIDVCSPEDCPPNYASELLSKVVEVTAKWDGACRILFDSAYWHPVDGKMRFFKAGAAVVAHLLMLDLNALADDQITSSALDAWRGHLS